MYIRYVHIHILDNAFADPIPLIRSSMIGKEKIVSIVVEIYCVSCIKKIYILLEKKKLIKCIQISRFYIIVYVCFVFRGN